MSKSILMLSCWWNEKKVYILIMEQGKKPLKEQILRNKFLKFILLIFVIVLICIIWFTQLRLINSSGFEVYEAGGNYLVFAEFDNTFIVPIKIKGVSIRSNNPDIPLENEIEDWGIWVDNASLLGAMILTDE